MVAVGVEAAKLVETPSDLLAFYGRSNQALSNPVNPTTRCRCKGSVAYRGIKDALQIPNHELSASPASPYATASAAAAEQTPTTSPTRSF